MLLVLVVLSDRYDREKTRKRERCFIDRHILSDISLRYDTANTIIGEVFRMFYNSLLSKLQHN